MHVQLPVLGPEDAVLIRPAASVLDIPIYGAALFLAAEAYNRQQSSRAVHSQILLLSFIVG